MAAQVRSSRKPHTRLQQIRRRVAQLVALFSFVRALVFGIPVTLQSVSNQTEFVVGLTVVILIAVTYLLWFTLATFHRVQLAAYGLLLSYTLLLLQTQTGSPLEGVLAGLIVATLIAGSVPFLLMLTALVGVVGYTSSIAINNGGLMLIDAFRLLITILLSSVVVRYFVSTTEETLALAERSSNLLRFGAEVGQITAGITTVDELLPQAVDFIRERFAFYHVQVFLVDEANDVAILRASTGAVGQKLLERGHRLNVGSNSVIGRVTLTGEPAIARDTDSAGVYFRNELLPNTRSELALPIKEGDRIIGALDVQSTRPNAFTPTDVQALQIMANLLAASILNARLFEEQQRSIQINQRMYIESESNLQEIERLNRQLTRQSWEEFVADASDTTTGVQLVGGQIQRGNAWTPLLQQAIQNRQPVSSGDGDNMVLAVPIMLRNEIIGAIEVEPEADLRDTDIVEIIRAVSERLAVSLENARLYEEAQETTVYEQRINEIVGQFQGASSVDDLLQITLTELSSALGAERGTIRLGRPEEAAAPSNGHNGAEV